MGPNHKQQVLIHGKIPAVSDIDSSNPYDNEGHVKKHSITSKTLQARHVATVFVHGSQRLKIIGNPLDWDKNFLLLPLWHV